jgi:hypothetical protein
MSEMTAHNSTIEGVERNSHDKVTGSQIAWAQTVSVIAQSRGEKIDRPEFRRNPWLVHLTVGAMIPSVKTQW